MIRLRRARLRSGARQVNCRLSPYRPAAARIQGMTVVSVEHALAGKMPAGGEVTVRGWVRTRRDSKAGLSFVNVSDGSCFAPIQVVAPNTLRQLRIRGEAPHRRLRGDRHRHAGAVAGPGPGVRDPGLERSKWSAGSRIRKPTRSSPRRTRWSSCAKSRTCARAPTCSARSRASATAWRRRCTASSTSSGFYWISTPIITTSDAEGAGQMFRVSTLDMANLPRDAKGEVDFSRDFFGKETFLTVSGQLNVEALLPGAEQGLHLRPDLPRREQQHHAPPGRVLDDRAGDRLRRPRRRRATWPRTSSSTCSAPCSTSAWTTWPSSPSACSTTAITRAGGVHQRAVRAHRLHRCDHAAAEVRQEVRVPGRMGPGPADRARALADRGARRPPGGGDELPRAHQGLLHAPQRRRQDRRRDGRAGAGHRRDHRRHRSARSAWTCSTRAWRSSAWIRRTTAGTAISAATAPCRTPASASASSAWWSTSAGCRNIRDAIPYPRAPGSAEF